MERKNIRDVSVIGIAFLFLIIGVFIYNSNPGLFHRTTPFALLLFAVISIIYAPRWQYLPIFVITFLIEALGVATGFPFGEYYYTERLGLTLLAVPLVIGINWVWVSIAAKQITYLVGMKNKWLQAVGAGLIVVIFDILLEPVAIALEWWVWPSGVGLPNYISWFIIGAAASLFIKKENKIIFPGMLAIQFIFFILVLVL